MNEIIINTNEIESVWEKDHLCFVKMKSGKVWLCPEEFDIHTGPASFHKRTKTYILESLGLVIIPLSQKGKCDNNG